MANPDSENAVGQLKNSPSPAEQLAALKHLKNQIIGHPEKKETLVQHGLIDVLAQVLSNCVKTGSSQRDQSANGSETPQASNGSASSAPAHDVHLQALHLIRSLAQGGLAFFYPLKAASIDQLLVASISPKDNPPQVVSTALNAAVTFLNTQEYNLLADRTKSVSSNDVWATLTIAHSFRDILSLTANSSVVRTQVSLVCRILQKTITSDQERDVFISTGILDCLAAHLASFYIHNHPGSGKAFNTVSNTLPAPPSTKVLPEVLGATNMLVQGSRYRVATLLLSPPLYAVLPFYNSQVSLEPRIHQPTQYATYDVNPSDLSVPWIHNGIQKTDNSFAKAFPALGTSQSNARNQPFIDFADTDRFASVPGAGVDSALTPWLIHLVRTGRGLLTVRAASLLCSIAKADYVCRSKSYSLALLVIPILLDVMKSSNFSTTSSTSDPLHDAECQHLYEAPMVLGSFVEESPVLGAALLKHAVEGGVIKELGRFLKQTFAPIDNRAPTWSANPDKTSMDQDSSPSCTLGDQGVSARVAYLFNCRKAALLLLAGIAGNRPGEDKYRKSLVENGAVQCIMDSLTPLNAGSMTVLHSQGGKEKLDASIGNPAGVILAACRAATAMSRSIYLLRTSLIDAGLSRPVFALIQNSDVELTLAATGVMCNLLVECSPMRDVSTSTLRRLFPPPTRTLCPRRRALFPSPWDLTSQDIIKQGVVKTLCEHAHSDDIRVRSISLWAMKHLVSQAPSEIKQSCVEQLDISWLMHVIDGNASTKPGVISTGGQTPPSKLGPGLSIGAASNALGERVSILHMPDDDEKMRDESTGTSPTFQQDPDITNTSLADNEANPSGNSTFSPFSKPLDPRHQKYLQTIKSTEEAEKFEEPLKQKQQLEAHALDILRNVLCPPGQHEMIDYVLGKIGGPRLYQTLATKLQPQQAESSMSTTSKPVDALPNKTLDSALKTLCHIAAGPPRHRNALVKNQQSLLQLLLPLFKHSNSEIRQTCCWICTNLMWVDDGSDVHSAKERASTLRRLGFESPLDELSRRPADGGREASQDVRERAAAARDCMVQATEGRLTRGNTEQGLGQPFAQEARAR